MALREINTNRLKMGDENALGKGLIKPKLEPAKRGPLGEISNKPAALRCTAVGKPGTAVNLKDVKAKVVTRHDQRSVNLKDVKPKVVTRHDQRSILASKESEAVEGMDVASISSTTLPQNVEDLDQGSTPLMLPMYVADIQKYLRELEIRYPIKAGYLSGQKVSERMRAVLIDWMVDVHQQFHLLLETLYLTVAIVDRFLQEYRTIDRSHLQLAGMTCMWVACKYEEMYCPEVSDFVYIADNTYTKTQIVQMESKILQTLNFNLGRPLPINFLRRFSKAAHSDKPTHTLAKYFLELTLVEYEMCHVPPSILAASALFIALWLVGGETRTVWNPTVEYYTEYTFDDILPIATQMASYIVKAPTVKYQATRRKFSSASLLKISAHPKLQSAKLAAIAKSLATF